jgi:hypothetical protein
LHEGHGAGELAGLQFLYGCFALFEGAAAEEDVVGWGGKEVGCEGEADAGVCCVRGQWFAGKNFCK